MSMRADELPSRLPIDGRRRTPEQDGARKTPMIDELDLVFCSRSEGDAYKSSHSAERNLNAAILRADISKSYEECLDIFETFYADDVEVSREGLREMIRGKEKVTSTTTTFSRSAAPDQ